MNTVDFQPSFYCLYIINRKGEEELFLQEDITPGSTHIRLDLFESEAALHRWVKREKEILAQYEYWGSYNIYGRLYAKKLYVREFATLMQENENIHSITVIDENDIRRLYFRDDLQDDFLTFPTALKKLYPKEPIYMIYRQRKLNEQVILQKESYFVTYPEIAFPLFSIGILEWADDLIDRRPEQGYYIEETTLHDLYMRAELNPKDPGLFILSKEEAPHYLLRKRDLKAIVDGTLTYR